MGCDELQGYLFAKPMSARAVLLWASDEEQRQTAFKASLFTETRPVAANEDEIYARAMAPTVVMGMRHSSWPRTTFPDTVVEGWPPPTPVIPAARCPA